MTVGLRSAAVGPRGGSASNVAVDDRGRFAFPSLGLGTYELTLDLPGDSYIKRVELDKQEVKPPFMIKLAPGSAAGIVVTLEQQGARISATVDERKLDDSGSHLVGIIAESEEYPGEIHEASPYSVGSFVLEHLRPGRYVLFAFSSSASDSPPTRKWPTNMPSSEGLSVDLRAGDAVIVRIEHLTSLDALDPR